MIDLPDMKFVNGQQESRGERGALLTRQAPHVRDAVNLSLIMNRVIVALVPCLIIGLYNTGLQANLALAELPMEAVPGWRARVLSLLGCGKDPASFVASLCHGILYLLPLFLVAALAAWFWEWLFASLQGRRRVEGFLVTALLFTLLLPPSAPLWQVAVGISFGVVFAKEVFGGTGKNFLNPSLAGLVFLDLAYPNLTVGDPIWKEITGYGGTDMFSDIHAIGIESLGVSGPAWWDSFNGLVQGTVGGTSTLACTVGALLLVYWRMISPRILVGIAVGLWGALFLLRLAGGDDPGPVLSMPWYWHVVAGSLAFGAVFMATDPVSSPMTDGGRWVYGLLIGFTVVLIRAKNPLHPDGVILAILLGNVFAPVIDSFVIWLNVRRRRHYLVRHDLPLDQ